MRRLVTIACLLVSAAANASEPQWYEMDLSNFGKPSQKTPEQLAQCEVLAAQEDAAEARSRDDDDFSTQQAMRRLAQAYHRQRAALGCFSL